MKRFLIGLLTLSAALLLFAACACGEDTAPQSSRDTTMALPGTAQTTAKPTDATGAPQPSSTSAPKLTETNGKPVQSETPVQGTTAPQSTKAPADPTLPSNLCLNRLEKMAVQPIAFEKPAAFSDDVGITYVFNDNGENLDETLIAGMQNKTVVAALRVNGTLYSVTDYERSGVYLRLNTEKAGVLLVAGVTYSVALEFYSADNSLLCYSDTELLATPYSTKKQPERKPLTVTLPTEGLQKVSVKQNTLSANGFDVPNNSSLANLFDGNTKTSKLIGTATEGVPTLYFSLSKAETLTHYTVYTANDAANNPDRNPAGWRLYGKVGDMWMLLSKVESTYEYEPGIQAANAKDFSYAITAPRECSEYKIEFIFTSPTMQLGEITLFRTEGYSVSTPDPNAGSLLNGMQGVQISLAGFCLIPEIQNRVGLSYYFTSEDSLADTIRHGLTTGEMFAAVTLDNAIYQIDTQLWNGNFLYLDLQSAGAPVFSGINYSVSLGIYNASGERLYYTSPFVAASAYQTPNLPQRNGLNITLPNGLSKVTVNSNSLKTENITHWGDGDPKNFVDNETKNTKIGGNVTNGEFTLTFKLNSAATLTYYTFYTGNDTSTHAERNPLGWVLYGKVGDEYVVLSDVRENSVAYSGMEAVNATPYSYKIDNPQKCTEYMIVFYTNEMFQLNEMVLYK